MQRCIEYCYMQCIWSALRYNQLLATRNRLAWVDWQQLESACGSGYLDRVGCGAGGSIAYLQAPQRAKYANKQWESRVSCMEYPAQSATLAASGSRLALRQWKPCLALTDQRRDHGSSTKCKGASSIATCSAPGAHLATISCLTHERVRILF